MDEPAVCNSQLETQTLDTGVKGQTVRNRCNVCGRTFRPGEDRLVSVPCNIRKFRGETFRMWRCAGCRCIHTWEIVPLERYYEGYGTNRQSLDFFTRIAYGQLLRRFRAAGLRRDQRFLDYGCGSGNLVRFLQSKGYRGAEGYDPYGEGTGIEGTGIKGLREPGIRPTLPRQVCDKAGLRHGGAPFQASYSGAFNPQSLNLLIPFKFICLQDVIEHIEDPAPLMERLAGLLEPGGILYIGTPSADEIDLNQTHRHLHQLHAPYHLHLYTRAALVEMGARVGLEAIQFHNRFYAETPFFGMNEAFCRAYLESMDDTIDALLDPAPIGMVLTSPRLLFHGLFGYLYSPRHSVTVVFRKTPTPPGGPGNHAS